MDRQTDSFLVAKRTISTVIVENYMVQLPLGQHCFVCEQVHCPCLKESQKLWVGYVWGVVTVPRKSLGV